MARTGNWQPFVVSCIAFDRRRKLFNFIENLLGEDEFRPERVNRVSGSKKISGTRKSRLSTIDGVF